MILAISSELDGHTREVLSRLRTRGASVSLLDLSAYPADATLTIGFGGGNGGNRSRVVGPTGTLDLDRCGVVWWRRPQPLTLHEEVADADHRVFALTEAHSAFSGLWLTLDAFWVNHPTADDEAARKVHQLAVAEQVGLRIPETCITSDVERARTFIARRGPERTVYKAFSGTERAWRETRVLEPGELEMLDSVRFAPVIFQEYIPAEVDLRITVVGDRLFPAAISTREASYEVDFRMVMGEARFEAVVLPDDVDARVREYMRRLGLVYGAIDMRRTPAGEHVFLEINPSGQWLFVEHRTGQPITDAMVDLLASHDRPGGDEP